MQFPEFISTHQRILISDSKALSKFIFKHSAKLKDGGYREEDFDASPVNVLSEEQILDAIQGPYSAFFLQAIEDFTVLARVRMAVHINSQDTLKDNLTPVEPELELDASRLKDFEPDSIKELSQAFDDCIENQCQQWEGQLFFWQMSITGALKNDGLNLSEMESDEFSAAEPISELLARYDSINVAPEAVKYPLCYADYFKLKAYLMILSALSRQHLPHDSKDIEKFMKSLKKPLQEINSAEKDLLKQQKEEIKQVLSPIAFAKFAKQKKK